MAVILSLELVMSWNDANVVGREMENEALKRLVASVTGTGQTDDTPPTAPALLNAVAVGESEINLTWPGSSDAESSVYGYNVYRNGDKITTVTGTSFGDGGLDEATAYTYEVSAVNGAGLESPKSSPVQATTLGDLTAPTIASVVCGGDPARVTVTFSENVGRASAETGDNYAIDNGITVSGAALGTNGRTVTLSTSVHSEGISYTLTVNNVRDVSSAGNAIAANSARGYEYMSKPVITLVQYFGSATAPNVVEDGFVENVLEVNDRGTVA